MKKIFASIFISLFLAVSAWGAAYYVDSDAADDTGAGTELDPWKTISKAMTTVAVGDTVYFQKGDTWQENWTSVTAAPASESERITFSSYGSGARPKFVAQGAGTRYLNVNNRSYLTFEGLHWDADSQTTIVGQVYGTSSNVTIDNCLFENGSSHGLEIAGNGNNVARNSTFQNNTSVGLRIRASNVTVESNTFASNGGGIYVVENSNVISNVTIQSNTISSWTGVLYAIRSSTDGDNFVISDNVISGQTQLVDVINVIVEDDGVGASSVSDYLISNNTVNAGSTGDNCIAVSILDPDGGVVNVTNNILSNPTNSCIAFVGGDGSIINRNRNESCGSTGDVGGIKVYTLNGTDTVNIEVSYNLILDSENGIILEDETTGDISGAKIYNNTIDNSTASSIQIGSAAAQAIGVEIKNNISSSPGSDHIEHIDTGGTVDYDYNLYYPEGNDKWTWGATTNIDDLATWKSTSSQDANAPASADPLFDNNYGLQAGSPARTINGTALSIHTAGCKGLNGVRCNISAIGNAYDLGAKPYQRIMLWMPRHLRIYPKGSAALYSP